MSSYAAMRRSSAAPIDTPLRAASIRVQPNVDPDTLDEARCPAVGFDLTDLGEGHVGVRHLEAM